MADPNKITIQASLEILNAKIKNIVEKLGGLSIAGEINDELLPKLPIDSIKEIVDLENMLENVQVEKSLFCFLTCIGGNSDRNCVFRCLDKLCTNFVARFCSWIGQKQNFRLCYLKIIATLRAAVRESFPTMKDETFARATMQWFQHGKTRFLRKNNDVHSV